MGNNNYPFKLIPLPYAYDALEPFIDKQTMQLHHDKHLQTYVSNLNEALNNYPQFHHWTLEQLIYYSNQLPKTIRRAVINNGGGIYNHNLFFAGLQNGGQMNSASAPNLIKAINSRFGSFDAFKDEFKKHATSVFGSGYTWLVAEKCGNIQIVNTKNQDTVIPYNLFPIILIDIWEHAYYLKYHNIRSDYVDNFLKILNPTQAESNFNKILT
ncbi:MAG: superoxide dismutase [Firmicutes bacterium]|nr:superoxide dismutase [Bacillota bacterium]MCL2255549.1 superoxide dismutase [Bacillota bacterium]